MRVEYRLLGPLEAYVDGRPIPLAPRERGVLAVLALRANRVVPAAQVIDSVWPEDPPDSAANLVQGYVSNLRRKLGRETMETREPGYLLRLEEAASDLARFEQLAARGRAALDGGRPDDAARGLAEAVALWHGPALADLATEGILTAEAARLDELRVAAVERRLEAELACGRHAEAIAELEQLVTEQPLREHVRALFMLALYRSGRQADALAAYRSGRQALVAELGIEPGPPLQELERRILAHDSALDLA